jgi:peptidoglycan hydrolase CwlO-like protein
MKKIFKLLTLFTPISFIVWGILTAMIFGIYWFVIKSNYNGLNGCILLGSAALAMVGTIIWEDYQKKEGEYSELYQQNKNLNKEINRLEDEIEKLKSEIKKQEYSEIINEPIPLDWVSSMHQIELLSSENQSLKHKIHELTDKLFSKNPELSAEYERLRAEIFDVNLKRKNEVQKLNKEIEELREDLKTMSQRYEKDKIDPQL